MRVFNQHTAAIDGIAPQTEGELDEKNPAVKMYIEKGWLVAAGHQRKAPEPSAAPEREPAVPPSLTEHDDHKRRK